jgi:hypothetical protein
MPQFCRFTAATLLLAAVTPAFALNGRMEASTVWAENINRASSVIDWRDTFRYELRGAVSHFRDWNRGLLTSGELEAGYEHVHDFTKLNAATLGASATVRQKFGLGAFAPFVAVDFGLQRRDTRLDFDDAWVASAALRLGKRITPYLRASVTGDWQQHYAQSAIFDTKHHRFFATLTWDITDWLQLSHGNGRLWGSFTANASATIWPRAIGGLLGRHIADYYNDVFWARTDAFGPGWVTYIIDGRVSFYWIELSPAIGRNTSLPLRFENRVSVNKVGVKYRQDLWTLSLLHRF